MNRIVLIGNGFDLAHRIPTKYEHFIDWYWEQWFQKLRLSNTNIVSDGLCTFKITSPHETWYSHLWCTVPVINPPKGKDVIESILNDNNMYEVIQSHLLYKICKSIEEKEWVDIENEYYSLLKRTITEPDKCGCTPEMANNQLRLIQELLAQYLCSLTMTSVQTNEAIKDIIYQPICMDDISISGMSHYYDHYSILAGYSEQEWSDLIRRYGISGDQAIFWGTEMKNFIEKYTYRNQEGKTIIQDYNRFPKQLLRPSVTMLLSFNYTFVADMYCLPQIGFPIHIHGDLQSYNNIIFGYGDELDDDYKSFLKLDDNECLRNIKSIKYLESSNYRSMLSFIESAPYQIYIMGHSCGKSDRTLLNTLFEHKNCVSIKPYYYRKEDGSDNYLDIIQNICRNFTDMKLMRDRVVNKTHCEPLPQSK